MWKGTILKELSMLKSMGVYSIVTLPPNRKAIGNRWVFEHKIEGADLIAKGRLVAKGFHQIPDIDYGKTFAPVAKTSSVRMLAAIAAKLDWELDCFDATRAFLWGELDEELYMKLPDGFALAEEETPVVLATENPVMRLHKSIYGLKQASMVWYRKFSSVLIELGMRRSETDHGVFVYHGEWQGLDVHCVIVIHVDDGMGGSNSRRYLDWVKAKILEQFGLKDLGPVKLFLGIQFDRCRETRQLWLFQQNYISTLLADYGLTSCNAVSTPMDKTHPLGSPTSTPPDLPNLPLAYQALMGRLLFLSICTRPDIAYAVNRLTRFNSNPSPSHYAAAKRILRYLSRSRDLKLHFGSTSGPLHDRILRAAPGHDLVGFSDSDWAGDEDRKSTSGNAWFLFNSLIEWTTKKQSTIALSSTEAEYIAIALAVQGGLWIRMSLSEMIIPHSPSTPICIDNEGAISLSSNSSHHSRAKHIDIKYHFIRLHTSNNTFSPVWLHTSINTADIFTKPLSHELHDIHVSSLGLTKGV
jgi:hypothetical protein